MEKYINIIRNASIQDLDVIREIALNAYEQYVDIVGKKPAPMIANFSEHLENDIVFVESTIYPSVTQKICLKIIEKF